MLLFASNFTTLGISNFNIFCVGQHFLKLETVDSKFGLALE